MARRETPPWKQRSKAFAKGVWGPGEVNWNLVTLLAIGACLCLSGLALGVLVVAEKAPQVLTAAVVQHAAWIVAAVGVAIALVLVLRLVVTGVGGVHEPGSGRPPSDGRGFGSDGPRAFGSAPRGRDDSATRSGATSAGAGRAEDRGAPGERRRGDGAGEAGWAEDRVAPGGSAPDEPEASNIPDASIETVLREPQLVVTATQVGERHVQMGRGNEDRCEARVVGDWTVMVVADGVTNSGDANCRPNRAAEVALGAAIHVIERELPSRARPGALNQWWRGVGALVMGEAARAIEQLAAPGLGPRVDKTPESTLAMACLGRIETKWTLFWTAVGDSEVALVREGKLRWVSLQQDVSDRYTRSATTFALPRHVGQAKSGIVALDSGDIVFVASDGCTDAFHEAPERQVDWLGTGLTSEDERTDAFTQVVGFEMADSYDDRTIVAALVPRPGAHQTPAGGD